MTNEDDLMIAVFDLYEKTKLQLAILLEIGPSILAVAETLTERDPGFREAFAKHYEAAKNAPMFQQIPLVIDLISQDVQRLKDRVTN